MIPRDMSTALILVDCQADNIAVGGDSPIQWLKKMGLTSDLVVASRRYAAKTCKKGTKGARIHPYVSKLADVIVTKEGGGVSAFEGGTLRPIESTERILKAHKIDRAVIGGYFLEWTVAQTAFDANALGIETSVDLQLTAKESSDKADYVANTILERLERAGVNLLQYP